MWNEVDKNLDQRKGRGRTCGSSAHRSGGTQPYRWPKQMNRTEKAKSVVAILAIIAIAWSLLFDESLLSSRLDTFMADKSDKVQMAYSLIAIPLMLLSAFGFIAGTAVLAIILFHSLNALSIRRDIALLSLTFPAVSIAFLFVQALPFLKVPSGTSIRPMAWAAMMMIIILILLVISVIRSFVLWRRNRNIGAFIIALLLSFVMIIIPSVSLHIVSGIKGFGLSP